VSNTVQSFFLVLILSFVVSIMFLQLNDDMKHRELNSIKYCIADCAEHDMVQAHTEEGCYCIDRSFTNVPLWEPDAPYEQRVTALAVGPEYDEARKMQKSLLIPIPTSSGEK